MKKRITQLMVAVITCISMCTMYIPTYAADAVTFEAQVQNDEGTAYAMTFKEVEPGKVQLGNGVQNDANITFAGGLTIPETIIDANTGKEYAVVAIADYAFSNGGAKKNTVITSITGASIKTIGRSAFYNCPQLASIDFSVAEGIGESTFDNCIALTTINLPNVTTINESAFERCTALGAINLPKVTVIETNAFYGCTSLTTIILPEIIEIKGQVFQNCTSLVTLNLAKTTTIAGQAFAGCSSLVTINLQSVTDIASGAFNNCTSLTTLNLPAVTTIEVAAFIGCSQLKTFVLGIKEDADYNFGEAYGYPETIYLPQGHTITELNFGSNKFVADLGGTIKTYDVNVVDPSSVVKQLGEDAELAVSASITEGVPWNGVLYQWQKQDVDGVWQNITNETNKILKIDDITADDAGAYRCYIVSVTYPSLEKVSSVARVTINPDVDKSVVTGIVEDATYTKGSTLNFSVEGAGMANTNPNEGDLRYEPRSWKVDTTTGTFNSYASTIDTKDIAVGHQTLEITFVQQKFVGSVWQDVSGNTYTKNVHFTVEKANNSWIKELTMTGWTYGNQANTPIAQATHGSVVFSYSNQHDGTYTNNVPTTAGTWYVKASVKGVTDYNDLESIVAFTIDEKDMTTLTITDIKNEEDIKKLVVKDGNDVLIKDKDYRVEVIEKDNKTIVNIIGKGNYTGTITREFASQKNNSWTKKLSIKGWTYGEIGYEPTATAAVGTPIFTYSQTMNGTYTTNKPTQVGTWYVKASVTGQTNYKDLESIVSFVIAPKSMMNIVVPQIKNDEELKNLIIKDGNTLLLKDKDYIIQTVVQNNKVIVTIIGKGNYTGTITREYEKTAPQTGDTTKTVCLSLGMILSGWVIIFIKKNKKSSKIY